MEMWLNKHIGVGKRDDVFDYIAGIVFGAGSEGWSGL